MARELVQGIADAIAGGALAGLSKEAQMDFFGPFMQAQAQRIQRAEQAESSAFSNYSTSSRASREAFSMDPAGEGKLQAAQASAQKRLNLALDSTQNPAARQALLDSYEADIAYFNNTYDGGVLAKHTEAARANDYSFLKGTSDPSLKQTAIETMVQPGTVAYENLGALQTLAARIGESAAVTGDLPGGASDADRFSLVEADPALAGILEMVEETKGAIGPWALKNPEQGATLMEYLGGRNKQSIEQAHSTLQKSEHSIALKGQLRDLSGVDGPSTGILYDRNTYAIDAAGNKTFRPDKIDDVLRDLNTQYDYAGDVWDELQRLESIGVDVTDVRNRAVRKETVRPVSSDKLGQYLEADFGSAIDAVSSGTLEVISQDPNFMRLIAEGRTQLAASHLETKGYPNPAKTVDLFYRGPRGMLVDNIERAMSGDAYMTGERARLKDQLALAQADGDSETVQALNTQLQGLASFAAGADFRTVQDLQLAAFDAVGQNTKEGYTQAILRVVSGAKSEGILVGEDSLSPVLSKQVDALLEVESPLRRHEEFGKLLANIALSSDGVVGPQSIAAKDRARMVAVELNERMVRALPLAVKRSGKLKVMSGVGSGGSPLDALYASLSARDLTDLLQKSPDRIKRIKEEQAEQALLDKAREE